MASGLKGKQRKINAEFSLGGFCMWFELGLKDSVHDLRKTLKTIP
jgi:hypothetical protein